MIIETENLVKVYRTEEVETTALGAIDLQVNEGESVVQNFNLIDELTVSENVELSLIYNRVPASERKKRVSEVLEKMDMGHRRNHFPLQLSGGQQQRVAVARAIATQPTLILADEPTGNLDSEHGDGVMRILAQLNGEGSTVFMVTHSEENAMQSNRVIRLLDGRILRT